MGDYFKLSSAQGLRQSTPEQTEYDRNTRGYFKWLKVVGTGRESSNISHLSISESDNLCSVSFGTKVFFYDYESQSLNFNYSSSKNFVRCTSFRSDSKMVAVSDDSGSINIIALTLKSQLRRFKAHEGPCHCHEFSRDKTKLLSGGDDGKVKLWDIPEEKFVLTLEGHTDKVRTLKRMPEDQNLWVTGCYDKMSRVYDVRAQESPVAVLNQDSPVEHVSFSSSGFRLLTTGGNKVKIWDMSSGIKLERSQEPHMRTIIGAYLSDEDNCLVTASLDGTVKFTDQSRGRLMHMYSHESQITAFDFKYNNVLTVGLASGEWLVRYNNKAGERMLNDLEGEKKYEVDEKKKVDEGLKMVDVTGYKPPKLSVLDRLVKAFQYQSAMDLALTLTPDHVYNLVELLIVRGTLATAVKNRDEKTILPLLKFVSTYLNKDVNNTTLILEFLITILDNNKWLQTCTDEAVIAEMKRIPSKINLELYQHTILLRLKGLIDLIL